MRLFNLVMRKTKNDIFMWVFFSPLKNKYFKYGRTAGLKYSIYLTPTYIIFNKSSLLDEDWSFILISWPECDIEMWHPNPNIRAVIEVSPHPAIVRSSNLLAHSFWLVYMIRYLTVDHSWEWVLRSRYEYWVVYCRVLMSRMSVCRVKRH